MIMYVKEKSQSKAHSMKKEIQKCSPVSNTSMNQALMKLYSISLILMLLCWAYTIKLLLIAESLFTLDEDQKSGY